MKRLILILLMFNAFSLISQTAYYTNLLTQWNTLYGLSGGNWAIPADEQQVISAFNTYGGTVSQSAVSGQPFTKALLMTTPTAGVNTWDAAMNINNTVAIAQGDVVLVTMWIRSTGASEGSAALYIEQVDTYDKEAFFISTIPTQWTQMIVPFAANTAYPVGKLRFGFQVGQKAQSLAFGGFAVRNYTNTYPLSQLPVNLNQHYAGSESNAPWRADAAARIEQIRKANLTVSVQDNSGNPVSGAVVQVKMLQHQFKFGSAITAARIAGNNAQDNTYESKILNFDGKGHGFNEIVFENDLKWPSWEGQWGVSHPELVHAVQWLRDHHISIRGHNLVWPGWQYLPNDMLTNQSNLTYLKGRINDRIQTMLTYPGLAGQIAEWDVLNEITANQELANAFKGTPGYPTGRELYVDILKKVKTVDPGMKAYLNDYVTLDQGNTAGSPIYAQCQQYIQEARSAGASIEGIGFQAHIGAGLVSIYDTKQTLDDFYAKFDCRAKITEYDYSDLVGDSLAARFTGDLLTLCFSHPSVDGFLCWGFWDGAHWLSNAPYFRKDWTMKPAGHRVAQLLFHDWWTPDTTLNTFSDGKVDLRGFKGTYQVMLSCGGVVQQVDTIELLGDKQLNFLCPTATATSEAATWVKVFKASPNPGSGPFTLEISGIPAPQIEFKLFNNTGELVSQTTDQFTSGALNRTLDFGKLPAGIYHLQAKTNKNAATIRLIIRP
jgi:GH35 family endo-1,4-beta-xylanase